MKKMDNIWNKRNLKPPMMSSYTTLCINYPYSTEIIEALEVANKYYNHQAKFHEAMSINQQLLYLRYTQFRTDIGFQQLQKLASAYKRLVSLNISALLSKISNSISIEKYNSSIQLPTKETFEYLLMKLMGLFKLLIRVVELAKGAAQYFVKLTNLSFFVELTTILLATLSDIYCIGSDMARKTINHYNKLYKYHSLLKTNKRKWGLPESFKFPENLIDCISEDESKLIKYNKLQSTDSSETPLEYVVPSPIVHVNKLIQQSEIEIGCEISRAELNNFTKTVKRKRVKLNK